MKGKRLFQLLQSLNKTTKRQLLNIATKSGDKRHTVLKELLGKNNASLKQLEYNLQQVFLHSATTTKSTKKSTKKEAIQSSKSKLSDAAIRRFTHFACTEIENLKIQNYLHKNQKMRNVVLAEILFAENHKPLFDYYEKRASKLAQKSNDLGTQLAIQNKSIFFNLRSGTFTSFQDLLKVQAQKHLLLNSYYHNDLARVYTLLSGTYIDNPGEFENNEDLIPDNHKFKQLVADAPSLLTAASYKLSQARFNFTNLPLLQQYLQEVDTILDNIDANQPQQSAIIKQGVLYLKILMGIRYGINLNQMLIWSKEALAIVNRLNIKDSTGFFFHLLLLLIDKQFNDYEQFLQEYQNLYFPNSTSSNNPAHYYLLFLKGLAFFLHKQYDESLDYLNQLLYNEDKYIAIWAQLLEIKIRFIKGNISVTESRLLRTNRYLVNNKNKYIIYTPSYQTMQYFNKLHKNNTFKPLTTPPLFKFYELLID